jgi:hypothetical protein
MEQSTAEDFFNTGEENFNRLSIHENPKDLYRSVNGNIDQRRQSPINKENTQFYRPNSHERRSDDFQIHSSNSLNFGRQPFQPIDYNYQR